MKKVGLFILIAFVFSFNSFSQTVTLQSVSDVPTSSAVSIDLSMTGFSTAMTAWEFNVVYDVTKLTFVNFSNLTTAINPASDFVLYENPVGSGILYCSLSSTSTAAVNGLVCKINFSNYNGPACTNLTYSDPQSGPKFIANNVYENFTGITWVTGQVCGVTTGVEENSPNGSVEIYPTIARDNLSIKYNMPESGKITIGMYNLMGDEIQKVTKYFNGNSQEIETMNTANLSAGLYFIKYHVETANTNTTKTEKFTVAK
ncbi:MAG: cohesin domain-containing protein [Bacteroidales bacterium]|jgi:hypothetical protein|nr:T9SS type A sorting domain-containing protein [Bacteroidales bacterium]MDD4215268.1 cohesin domain-containing protein [Bacteroidales bacterium]